MGNNRGTSRWSLLTIVAVTILYLLVYASFHPWLGPVLGLLSTIPVGLTARFWGLPGGILSAGAFVAINVGISLFLLDGPSLGAPAIAGLTAVNGVLIAIGVSCGVASRLRQKLHRQLSDHVKVETALRESETRWRAMVEYAPHTILMCDRKGMITFVNRGTDGYTVDDVIGRNLEDFLPADRGADVEQYLRQVFEAGEMVEVESETLRADGSRATYRSRYGPLYLDDAIVRAIIIAQDTTEQTQLGGLRSRFVEQVVLAQEDERRRIARELHDGIGQSLTSLLMGLRLLEDADSIEAMRSMSQELRSVIRGTMDDLSRLARGLHPTILDDMGFVSALTRYCEEFEKIHDIKTDVQINGFRPPELLPSTIQLSLYRIVQEALNNVAKHARAESVSLIVERKGGWIHLIVEDDGEGFEVNTASGMPEGSAGLGLVGIRERAALLQGSATVESSPGTGTTLFVRAPVTKGAATAYPPVQRAQSALPKLT